MPSRLQLPLVIYPAGRPVSVTGIPLDQWRSESFVKTILEVGLREDAFLAEDPHRGTSRGTSCPRTTRQYWV